MNFPSAPIRIVVADSHPVRVHGLTAIIEACSGYRVVTCVSDGEKCLEALQYLKPDISIIGTKLPSSGGWQILAAAMRKEFATRIVLFAPGHHERDGLIALSAGAYGFILHNSAAESIHDCLAHVAVGKKWLPPPREFQRKALSRRPTGPARSLTDREREVTLLAAHGLSNKAIARRLEVSDGTVRIHLQNIFRKIGVANRTELSVRALAAEPEFQKDT